MNALLLSPHSDDAALFAAFTCQAHKPLVVTLLNGSEEREAEDRKAMEILGCQLEQWMFNDTDPDWESLAAQLSSLNKLERPERVFAPWPEPGGHPQHNQVGELAREVFDGRVTFYTTYRFGGPVTVGPIEVTPEPPWILAKLKSLACYESQILNGPRRFFMSDLHEYHAA